MRIGRVCLRTIALVAGGRLVLMVRSLKLLKHELGGVVVHYEIEFFPVGDASRAGDAILIRYAVDRGYRVMVVDGGTDDSGAAMVRHIREVYGAGTVISDVVSTHPDTDHSCGLRAVLDEFPVDRLWVHGLWHHASAMLELFQDPRWTADGLAKAIKKEYPVIAGLIDTAIANGTEVLEPFAGAHIGPFTVLSPRRATYQHLVPQFRKTPALNAELLKQRRIWLGEPQKGFLRQMFESASDAAANLVPESWDRERLKSGGVTAAENESSTVLLGEFGGTKILLTADAGVNALSWAIDNAATLGKDLTDLRLIQVPHHGSRRNVSPEVLDVLVGPRLPAGSGERRFAVVSVPKDDANHPRKMVINAFTRRGAGVRKTQGRKFRFHSGSMPPRPSEAKAEPFGFFDRVEEYD